MLVGNPGISLLDLVRLSPGELQSGDAGLDISLEIWRV